MKDTFWLADTVGVEAAALDGERERALLLVAGAHAARTDDALAGIEGEVGIAGRPSRRPGDWRPRSRSALRAGRRRRPCPAVRSARSRDRSGSRADDRRCTAPSRRGGCRRAACSACVTFMPCATGVVHEAGSPFMPSICTRHRRQEPKASSCSVAHSLGILTSGERRGAHHRGALRHRHLAAVDGERDDLGAVALRGTEILFDNR